MEETQTNQSHVALEQSEPRSNNNTGKMKVWLIALSVVALASSAFGVWAIVDNNTQKDRLNSQIEALKNTNKDFAEKWVDDDGDAEDISSSELEENGNVKKTTEEEAVVDNNDNTDSNTNSGTSIAVDNNDNTDSNTNSGTSIAVDNNDYIYIGKMGIKIKIPQKNFLTVKVSTDRVPAGPDTWSEVSTFNIYETRPGGGITGQIMPSCDDIATGFNNWKCFAVGDINLFVVEIGGAYEGTLSEYFWNYFTDPGHYSKI